MDCHAGNETVANWQEECSLWHNVWFSGKFPGILYDIYDLRGLCSLFSMILNIYLCIIGIDEL